MLNKRQSFWPGLALVGLLVVLSGCGFGSGPGANPSQANTPPAGTPDTVKIEIDEHLPEQVKPVVTLADAELVQQLYTAIYDLAVLPKDRACTNELGPQYTLTFNENTNALKKVDAMRYGCREVVIEGETDARGGDEGFWKLLDKALEEASPPAKVEHVSVVHTSEALQPVQSAQITETAKVQQLYDAILALPKASPSTNCIQELVPTYQLLFTTSEQSIPAMREEGCGTITLKGDYKSRGGTFQMSEEFKTLFAETLASATFSPAQPERLELSITGKETSQQSLIENKDLIQKLYAKLYTLPTAEPEPNCPSDDDKVAGKGTHYTFRFIQRELPVLNLEVYEGSCKRISITGSDKVLQGDQDFWGLVHQAAGPA